MDFGHFIILQESPIIVHRLLKINFSLPCLIEKICYSCKSNLHQGCILHNVLFIGF